MLIKNCDSATKFKHPDLLSDVDRMDQLPAEILARIFRSVVEINMTTRAAGVCRLWQQIIISDPVCWTKLRYDVPWRKVKDSFFISPSDASISRHHFELIRTHLVRSKNFLLDVTLIIGENDSKTSALDEDIPAMTLTVPYPELQQLLRAKFNRLRSYTEHGSFSNVVHQITSSNVLTHLHVKFSSFASQCSFPALRSLVIDDWVSTALIASIKCPNLQSLTLLGGMSDPEGIGLSGAVRNCPILVELVVKYEVIWMVRGEPVYSLKHLKLHNIYYIIDRVVERTAVLDGAKLLTLLRRFPNVEVISLMASRDVEISLGTETKIDLEVAPRIKEIRVDGAAARCLSAFTIRLFTGVIRICLGRRRDHTYSGCSLGTLGRMKVHEFFADFHSGNGDDFAPWPQLQELVLLGVQLAHEDVTHILRLMQKLDGRVASTDSPIITASLTMIECSWLSDSGTNTIEHIIPFCERYTSLEVKQLFAEMHPEAPVSVP